MNHWLVWSLLSAFFAGLTAVLAKVGIVGVDSNLATAIRTSVVVVFAWVVAWVVQSRRTGPGPMFAGLTQRTVLFLVLSGLATGLSWVCYFRALQLGDAGRVAPVDKLSVLFVIAFAAFWLREPLGWPQWLGGGLILGGAALLAWKH